MIQNKHTNTPHSAKDVAKIILNTDRVMPAHFTNDDVRDRAKSFLINYKPLGPDAEYQMASVAWSHSPTLLKRPHEISKSLLYSLVRLFENSSLAGYIITYEGLNSSKPEVMNLIKQFQVNDLGGGSELADIINNADVEQALEDAYQTGVIEARRANHSSTTTVKLKTGAKSISSDATLEMWVPIRFVTMGVFSIAGVIFLPSSWWGVTLKVLLSFWLFATVKGSFSPAFKQYRSLGAFVSIQLALFAILMLFSSLAVLNVIILFIIILSWSSMISRVKASSRE